MSTGHTSSCTAWQETLARSVDGPLAARERRALEAHLECCGDCRSFAETLGLVEQFAARVFASEAEEAWTDDDTFLAVLSSRLDGLPRRTSPLPYLVTIAAAILLTGGLVALVLHVLEEKASRERSPYVAEHAWPPVRPSEPTPATPAGPSNTESEPFLVGTEPEDLDRVDPLRLYGARYVVEKALLSAHGLEGEALLTALRDKTAVLRRERWPIEHLVLKLVDRNADEPRHLSTDERAMLVALHWIGSVRPRGALPVLKRVLEPEPRTPAVRREALMTLARLGQERAFDHLVELGRRSDAYPEAAAALAAAGDRGLERLLELYEGANTLPTVRNTLENHRPALDRVLARRIGSWTPDPRAAELYRLFGGQQCRDVLLAEAERKRRLGEGLVTVAVAIGGVEAFDLLLETVEKSSPRERERLTASLTELLELEREQAPSLVRRSAHLLKDDPLERINAIDALTSAAARIESGQASACLLAILELSDLAVIQKANVLLHLLNRPRSEAPGLDGALTRRLAEPTLSPIEFAGVVTVLAGRSSVEDVLAKPLWKTLDDSRRRRLVRGLEETVAAQPGVAGLTALDRLIPLTEASRRRTE